MQIHSNLLRPWLREPCCCQFYFSVIHSSTEMTNCCISHCFSLPFHFQNYFFLCWGFFFCLFLFWGVVFIFLLRTTRSNVKSYLQVRSGEKQSPPQAANYSQTENLLVTRFFFWAGPAPTCAPKAPEAAQYRAHAHAAPARVFPFLHSKDATTPGTNSASHRSNFLCS